MKKLISMLFCALVLPSMAFAAPPLNPSMSEPPEYPGMKLQQRLAPSLPTGLMPAPASYPTTTVKILFLRVDFPADSDTQTEGSGEWTSYTSSAYSYDGTADCWVNRAKDKFIEYWKEVSYGMLPISIDISPNVYRLGYTMAHYGTETYASIENLIYDSVSKSQNDIAFSNYDAVLIVHAGVGEETDVYGTSPYDIWSLYYQSSNSICQNASSPCLSVALKNGLPISDAIIMPQTDSRDGFVVDPLGVYVHEFGHWLGLPDLYCTSYACVGAGMWSLMADGSYNSDPGIASGAWFGSAPAHLDAWSLSFLDWVSPLVIGTNTQNVHLPLNPIESVPAPTIPAQSMNAYKAQASTSTSNQYFLLENRQQIGFDTGLPGNGLLVWLIDQEVINANFNSNTINDDPARPGVKLIEADGDWALLTTGSASDAGSAGDPFPGSKNNIKLSPMTDPSSIPYTAYGWVNMRNIDNSSSLVSFDFGFGPLPPTNVAVDRTTGTLSWTASASGSVTSYRIYKNGDTTTYQTTNSTSFVDGAYLASDVYAVTAVDGYENESQAAMITPVISVTPTSLSLSDTNPTGTLTLSNSGNADLAIQSISITGASPSYFSFSSACGATVAAGASCSITVTFSPSGTGEKSAELGISTNDLQNPTVTISLTGASSSFSSSSSSTKSSGWCFIATAAYGSYLDPRVQVLRDFRDRYLLTNAFGKAAVSFYYRHSPPIAGYLGRHEGFRMMTRWALTPVVLAIAYPLPAMMAFIMGIGAGILAHKRKKRLYKMDS